MGIIDGIIGGAASLASSGIQAKTAKYNTDRTIAANRQMAEYEFSKNLEMWNKGNEYNSPAAQMERLKEAGLNPNLVYGSGSVSGNSSGSLPEYNAPTAQYNYKPPVDWGDVISSFQDVQLKQAQIDNVKKQNQGIDLSNTLKNWENETIRATIESNITRKLKENEAAMSKEQMNLLKNEWDFENWDSVKQARNSELIKTNADAGIAIADKQIKEVAARYAKAQALVGMITKGVGAAAGAVGATGILKAFSSTAKAAKNPKPVISSKTVKTPGYEAFYNYK